MVEEPLHNDSPYKRKIDQRADKPRKTTDNPTIRMDFDVSGLVGVPGYPEDFRLWKGTVVLFTDRDANTRANLRGHPEG